MTANIEKLVSLRKEIHQHPDRSGHEEHTAQRIQSFIEQYKPDEVVTQIGGHGIAFRYNGKKNGPVVLIRCELDALPIAEINTFEYHSVVANISHKCGHDGHMAIVAGLAAKLYESEIKSGAVVLLFQPAEETGQGAHAVVNDPKFASIQADYCYALHNIPGYPVNSIICKQDTFSLASVGMVIQLTGKTSHAGEPDKGINPALAIADLIREIINLPQQKTDYLDYVLSTIVHIDLGEIAFGTSAGYAELRATLRGNRDEDVELLKKKSIEAVTRISNRYGLKHAYEFVEYFPAVINHTECFENIKIAAQANNLQWIEKDKPFPWSEDFSHLIKNGKGAMFGLGAGEKHPQLHNPDFDFPDELIETGIAMFYQIINQHLA